MLQSLFSLWKHRLYLSIWLLLFPVLVPPFWRTFENSIPLSLPRPYSALVRLMYAGDPCATCGLRFRDRKTEVYSSHLDWHYKMNSRDKSLQRSRNWFLHPEVTSYYIFLCHCLFLSSLYIFCSLIPRQDWLKFEESTADEENRGEESIMNAW